MSTLRFLSPPLLKGLLVIALGCTPWLIRPALSQSYQLIDLGANVTPQDINDSGQVAGFLRNPDYSTIAVTYDIATHTLQTIRGASAANGINDNGLIVGTTASGAFYMDGTFHDLGEYYSAHGLNELGQIAGSKSNDNPYRLVPRPTNPAIYDVSAQLWRELEIATVYARGTVPGVYADLYTLTDINDSGYAVGNYRKYGLTTAYGFLVTPAFDTVLTPIAGSNSTANAINEQGLIVGGTVFDASVDPYQRAYLYDLFAAQMTDLGTLDGGYTSVAMDINDANQVVGYSATAESSTSLVYPDKYHAFIWQAGVMTDLNGSLASSSGWILNMAQAINNHGDIVGTGWFDGASHGFVLVSTTEPDPTPEPPPELVAPVAVVGADPLSGIAPLTVAFDGTGSYDPDGVIAAYHWDFGDGTTSASAAVSHLYALAGSYTATLTVTDDDGRTGQASVTISVSPPADWRFRYSR